VDPLAQTQERLDGIWGRLGKIMGRIGDGIRRRLCEIPDRPGDGILADLGGSPDRLDQIWDCLMWRHYAPSKDSVASLASLHAFVNEHRDKTITVGDKQLPAYPYMVQCLDGLVDQARRSNDAGWLRKYTQAIQFASAGATHKLDLTARSLVTWRELRENLKRPPSRKELVERVKKETGIKYTQRQWRRVFTDLAKLFEQSK
jgi:hypothetical protein